MNGLVAPDAFKARLAEIGSTIDPVAGLYGPASVMWRVQRESAVFLGAGAALLLQTAHPFVAQGVADHSRALADPLGRYYRTFRPVFAMVFGTGDDALGAARRVRAVHGRIHGVLPEAVGAWPAGTRYAADDARALFWVHATLWHTSVQVYERMFGPLTEKDRYYDETKRFAALFGLSEGTLPASWSDFEARFAETLVSGEIGVGGAGRLIGDYFLSAAHGSFGRVLPKWYRTLTASLLPRSFCQAFGLPNVTSEEAAGLWARVAGIYRRVPEPLRFVGPYQEARRRLAGHEAGVWVGLVNRIWLGQPRIKIASPPLGHGSV